VNAGNGVYRVLLYALRYSDPIVVKYNQRAVFVFKDRNTFNVSLVGPREIIEGTALERKNANIRSLENFKRIIIPSKVPYIYDHWKEAPGQTPYEAFPKNSGRLLLTRHAFRVEDKMKLLEETRAKISRLSLNSNPLQL
jgi:hypothetical protein